MFDPVFGSDYFKLQISDKQHLESGFNRNPVFYYALEGVYDLDVKGNHWLLHTDDFMLMNPEEKYTGSMMEIGMLGALEMNYSTVSEYLDYKEYDIICSSLDTGNEHRNEVKRCLHNIFEYYMSAQEQNTALICERFFELLYILREYYRQKKRNSELLLHGDQMERTALIQDYIRDHYNERITLNDLSKETYFSTAYLSRYIKKKFGKNFSEVLSEYRLDQAMRDLLNTDNTFLKIAMDHGFPNSVSFNRAFKEQYQVTPSEYRRQHQVAGKTDEHGKLSENENTALAGKIQNYVQKYDLEEHAGGIETQKITASVSDAHTFQRNWCKLVNAGAARDLLRADMQEHLTRLKKGLDYEYVRIWDIYAPEMMLYDGNAQHIYNFSKLDIIFDFLNSIKIHPYIELGFKPVLLMKNATSYLVRQERKVIFKDTKEYADFLDQFMKHYVSRYGIEELEKWYFEQWMDGRLNSCEAYFDVFEAAFTKIKSFSPNIKVGGPGYGGENKIPLTELMSKWRQRYCYPDFISFYGYPYQDIEKIEGFDQRQMNEYINLAHRSTDSSHLLHYIDTYTGILHENGFWHQEIHLSEWNFTVSNRNVLNDSVFKGAYVVKNLMDIQGKVDIVGYWYASDLLSEYFDTQHLLDGSGGIMTKDAICKPAYYGFSFFNRLHHYMLSQEQDCIITTNMHDSYSIVLHHYKHPGYNYFRKNEELIRPEDVPTYFDPDPEKFHVVINGVRNGTYQIKIRLIDANHGSVQDEWRKMEFTDHLNLQDIEYLQQICVPHISMETHEVTDGTLELTEVLEANAIMHLHIFYIY